VKDRSVKGRSVKDRSLSFDSAEVALRLVYRRLNGFRVPIVLGANLAVAALAYFGAYLLRFEFQIPPAYLDRAYRTLPWVLLLRAFTLWASGLLLTRWRFVGLRELRKLAGATLLGSLLIIALLVVPPTTGGAPPIPSSVVLLDFALTLLFTAGLWSAYRGALESVVQKRPPIDGPASLRVLIVGAGEAGFLLLKELERAGSRLRVVGLVDDDPLKHGILIAGVRVLGGTDAIASIARSTRAEKSIIAIPSATTEQFRRIVAACTDAGLRTRVVPRLSALSEGRVDIDRIRPVKIEDLLGRDPVQLQLPELAQELQGQSVLVTGAAGSIGRELVRQLARNGPEALILLDQAETPLFHLDMDLREAHPELEIHSLVGDVAVAADVERAFSRRPLDRIYHAAAYKHVPLMELNPFQAFRNNVLGTYRMAEAAGRHGVRSFLLVSTDKAVRPVNVMGASKRLAECAVLALQQLHPNTAYASVRFGNVLGSHGSVIPIFQRQIERGKPLTVTHPEATRYFMTIPEAVQLILQASLLPELRGHIAMLEMGEPMRILDLARNLLRLSGVTGPVDERIVFTGLRPGERLHEELLCLTERRRPTPISKVHLVEGEEDVSLDLANQDFLTTLARWAANGEAGGEEALTLLLQSHLNRVVDPTLAPPPGELLSVPFAPALRG